MRYVTILAVLLTTFTGCITQKQCYRKFPPLIDTVKIVLSRDSIVYKDTTLYLHIPGDTVWNTVEIPCPPPPPSYIPDTVTTETEYAHAMAWLDHPFIRLVLIQKPTDLEWRLDSAIKESYHWKELYIKESSVIKTIPLLYRIALWVLVGMILANALFVLVLILRK